MTAMVDRGAAAGAFFLPLVLSAPASGTADEFDAGRKLYLENCASCHGADLEGQPDWRRPSPTGRMPAPPHDDTGHTWHHSDSALFRITKFGPAALIGGGYESDMPAYDGILSDEEIRAVLDYIKSAWPERERRIQAERSRGDGKAGQ